MASTRVGLQEDPMHSSFAREIHQASSPRRQPNPQVFMSLESDTADLLLSVLETDDATWDEVSYSPARMVETTREDANLNMEARLAVDNDSDSDAELMEPEDFHICQECTASFCSLKCAGCSQSICAKHAHYDGAGGTGRHKASPGGWICVGCMVYHYYNY